MALKNILLTGFVSILLFTTCRKGINTTFSTIYITTDNNKLVEINIPEALGNNPISQQINAEINAEIKQRVSTSLQIGENTPNEEASIEEAIKNFNEEYNRFITDFPDSNQVWEAQIDGELIYQSPEVISISITSYTNTGGAHGLVHISFLNFDATTGKRISNSRLIKDIDTFKATAKTYFHKAIDTKNTLFEPGKFQLPQHIGFSEEGLILLYNTYEIAPYSAGIIEFTIPAEKAADLLAINSPY